MKSIDRVLQYWRISKVRPYISKGDRVLDIGCADGILLKRYESLISESWGIDYDLKQAVDLGFCRLISGKFPDDLPPIEEPFDVITILAVLEHILPLEQKPLAQKCFECLKPGGSLVITIPSPKVDYILDCLFNLKLVDGMSLDEHYGFDPKDIPALFKSVGFVSIRAKKFQLGLNNLFVFRKPDNLD